jgi:hypothetical protein
VPELVILALVVALAVATGVLGTDSGPSSGASGDTVSRAHVALVARRVEALRDLRFRHPVRVAIVSPAQARRVGIADYERREPSARRRASEELLKLLDLLPADADLGAIEASVFEEQVAGYYDPRRGRLALVRGAGVDDVTLAHELTHALEDQHADLERLGSDPRVGDDASTAQQALVEGSATLVMERYAARWPSEAPLGDALAGLTQVTGARPLPQYVARSLVFPYFQGESFAEALVEADSGGWDLVDVALRARPPSTTAEILEPDRWLRAQQPQPVSLAAARRALAGAGGWRRVAGSTLGAEDVAALVSSSSGLLEARELTAGWRGGRYALWRRGPLADEDCPAPCRARDAAVLSVRMGSALEAQRLARALRRWSGRVPAGSATAVRTQHATVRVALAPDRELAARLTR